jgi:hypothetical protein
MRWTIWAIVAAIGLAGCARAAPEGQAAAGLGPHLSSPRAVHASVALRDGRVLLIGGYAEGRIELTDRVWLVSVPARTGRG